MERSGAGTPTSPGAGGAHLRLLVLGEFRLSLDDRPVAVPVASQRVLVLLALSESGVSRSSVAGTLWREKTRVRAAANLRGALWRMPEPVRRAVDTDGVRLGFDRHWSVDLAEARTAAARLRGSTDCEGGLTALFQADLLDGWDEPWLVIERERFHQQRIHALELLAERQLAAGDTALAAETALAAVAAEPLRESATCLLLQAVINRGNRAAAIQHYREFADRLQASCGVRPGPRMQALVAPHWSHDRRR